MREAKNDQTLAKLAHGFSAEIFSRGWRIARSHTNRPVKISFRRASAKPTSCVASYRKLNSGNGSRSFCHNSQHSDGGLVAIVVSLDPSDPKLAHLDGLNLSRAWMLQAFSPCCPLMTLAVLRWQARRKRIVALDWPQSPASTTRAVTG